MKERKPLVFLLMPVPFLTQLHSSLRLHLHPLLSGITRLPHLQESKALFPLCHTLTIDGGSPLSPRFSIRQDHQNTQILNVHPTRYTSMLLFGMRDSPISKATPITNGLIMLIVLEAFYLLKQGAVIHC